MKETKNKKAVYSKFDDERSVAMSILPKADKKIKTRRFLMILGYIGYIGLWGIALAFFQALAVYLATFSVVTLLIIVFFTWRFTKIEYELTIHMGQLGFALIYGGLNRKELFSCAVRDLAVIAPYDEAGQANVQTYSSAEIRQYCTSLDTPDLYYAVYEPQGGPRTVLIFDTEEKTRKMLKYYNSTAFKG